MKLTTIAMGGIVGALACAIGATRANAGTPAAGFLETVVASGLSAPTAIAFLPDGKLLITEQGGDLILSDGGSLTTLTNIPVCSSSEMGLLGIAIDPNFATNGFVYLYRTKAGGGGCGTATGRFNQVVRITLTGDPPTFVAGSLVELLTGIRTDNGNHDGGVLRIGPDGTLFIGAGDTGNGDNQGGPGSSTNPYSQDLSSLNGKVLRINLDGTIPADNPFVAQVGPRTEIFAYGFRNPFRFAFDPQGTHKLWVADVGDLTVEEIDIVPSGANASWPYCEGTLPGGCAHPGDLAPIFTYPHSGMSSLGTSIIGGSFAPATFGTIPSGDYFFGDYTGGAIYHASVNGTRDGISGSPDLFVDNAAGPTDMIFGPDHAMYYVAINTGQVLRVASVGAPPSNISNFTCYKATLDRGQAKLPTGTQISLQDQFDASPAPFDVKRAVTICNPAQRDGSIVVDPTVHQEGFQIHAPKGAPRFFATTHVTVDDFAVRSLSLTRPDSVLVPSNKVLGNGGAPPYSGTTVDHYKCYAAKLAKGSPRFAPPAAPTVQDEFFPSGQSMVVKKVTKLCTPVAADGSTINHEESHLVCYQAVLPRGVHFPAHTTVSTNNPDFGDDVLKVTGLKEICLPALKDP